MLRWIGEAGSQSLVFQALHPEQLLACGGSSSLGLPVS